MVQHLSAEMRSIVHALLWLALVFVVPRTSLYAAPMPIHTNGTPRFAAVIPDGFEAVRVTRGTNVFAMYRRPADEVLLVFVRLPGEIPRGVPDPVALRTAHESDPFVFLDNAARWHALGFDVDGAHGVTTAEAQPVIRWLAFVPTEGRAVAILAVAPASHDADAHRALEEVLASVRGTSSWQTPLRHAVDVIARVGFAIALAVCVLYALLLALFFRGKPERAPIARGTLLATAGLGWIAFSAAWFAQPGFAPRLVALFIAGLGSILAAQGMGIVRRRRA